jgi:hypothetical protein
MRISSLFGNVGTAPDPLYKTTISKPLKKKTPMSDKKFLDLVVELLLAQTELLIDFEKRIYKLEKASKKGKKRVK